MSGRPLHHVALGAHDVETVAAFYRDVFGLVEVTRHTDASGALRAIWLDSGRGSLMGERTRDVASRVEGIGPGPFLLAFRIEPDDKPRLEGELESRGIPVESRTEFTSYARDPEGNR